MDLSEGESVILLGTHRKGSPLYCYNQFPPVITGSERADAGAYGLNPRCRFHVCSTGSVPEVKGSIPEVSRGWGQGMVMHLR